MADKSTSEAAIATLARASDDELRKRFVELCPWSSIVPHEHTLEFVRKMLASVAQERETELKELRETNARLNRRCQSAEAALNERTEDWNKRSTDKQRNHYYTRYTEAEAECERLRAELAQAKEEHEKLRQHHIKCLDAWRKAEAELAQAQGYVEHLPDCPARHERPIHLPRSGGPVIDTAFGCSCGLDELLARLRDLPPVSTTGEGKK